MLNRAQYLSLFWVLLCWNKLNRRNSIQDILVSFDTLQTARKILYNYGIFNATSERWGENVENMLEVLSKVQDLNIDSKRNLNSSRNDFETFNKEMIMLVNEGIGLNDLKNFQQSFVPSNIDSHFNTLTYENIATLNNNGSSFDVFMYDV
ncbi:DEHA2A14520p [Debaryomyces hansenii CBS767]|uniref:DEHA2A14520p n=1 Tax=Debaryomyces hansenii (strain ATCC 36239 / CBS 767 / BCRC 21394 / JCM 1990 / NBRC 0083 / IGC 2968) TaxID=284592 RepID=B5RSN2_DEBHA|nr:DEHA2A14520p [Debaryomyces hansenii CBS767]CAR65417.1 DEHA2A14520p [Debaryomyces hansenii CBS767]|eukprot:XP_002770042.1 DEHA2A14520p [Debaryomyces hansenii CBS767]